jgi:hypothetical protein
MPRRPPRTHVYIDGFNLYHGAVEGTPYKWLDIGKLCREMFPRNEIAKIYYFTSPATDTPDSPDRSVRQRVFWRALDTLAPLVERIEGNFVKRPRRYPLAPPRKRDDPDDPKVAYLTEDGPTSAVIEYTEEKGSDVNLAAQLLADAFRRRFRVAIVLSNDGDLVMPIRIVTEELGLPVGVVNPRARYFQPQLAEVASFKRNIQKKDLRRCLFPDTLTDAGGAFTKPPTW